MERKRLMRLIVRNLRGKGAKRIVLFGSYAMHKEKKGSDMDLLVEFSQKKSLLDIIRIERELSEESGVKIDLVTRKAISPLIFERIKDDMKVIYQ